MDNKLKLTAKCVPTKMDKNAGILSGAYQTLAPKHLANTTSPQGLSAHVIV